MYFNLTDDVTFQYSNVPSGISIKYNRKLDLSYFARLLITFKKLLVKSVNKWHTTKILLHNYKILFFQSDRED
jgi:hypothetical protein